MAFGKRIKFFRNLKKLTQRQFGEALGFMGRTSDVRIAQYESEARTPKDDMFDSMAAILDVSPLALKVPDIDSYTGLMHTLFALEDTYGLEITELEGEICMRVNPRQSKDAARLLEMLCSWREVAARLESGQITKEEYDAWRYHYPRRDTSRIWASVPSQTLSDAILSGLKKDK